MIRSILRLVAATTCCTFLLQVVFAQETEAPADDSTQSGYGDIPEFGGPESVGTRLKENDEDREALLAWIENGAPEGDPADAPHVTPRATGWQIGEPDAVVRRPEPFRVPR